MRARNKAGKPLTCLQMKLQYLRIISQLPSYGTRYFLVSTSSLIDHHAPLAHGLDTLSL